MSSAIEANTRERILGAAWRLLEAADGGDVRMRDIAAAAGVSRQALYLHFATRTELLVATTRHIDQVLGLDDRLRSWRSARTGREVLRAWIHFWGEYIPQIHPVARALMASRSHDPDAAAAWADRMRAVHDGCRITCEALARDGILDARHSVKDATDLLWAILSVSTWELLVKERGWTSAAYVERMNAVAESVLAPSA